MVRAMRSKHHSMNSSKEAKLLQTVDHKCEELRKAHIEGVIAKKAGKDKAAATQRRKVNR